MGRAARQLEASLVSGTSKRAFGHRMLGLVFALALLGGLGALVVSGFVEGRQEAAVEAEREGPIKPPLRVKLPARGEPIVTFDAPIALAFPSSCSFRNASADFATGTLGSGA